MSVPVLRSTVKDGVFHLHTRRSPSDLVSRLCICFGLFCTPARVLPLEGGCENEHWISFFSILLICKPEFFQGVRRCHFTKFSDIVREKQNRKGFEMSE